MRDGSTGKLIWESSAWGPDMFEKEMAGTIITYAFKKFSIFVCISSFLNLFSSHCSGLVTYSKIGITRLVMNTFVITVVIGILIFFIQNIFRRKYWIVARCHVR